MAVAWEEYFRLAFGEKLLLKQLEQNENSSALQLILKKQELAAADRGLQAQKKEFHSTMKSVNQRWIELEKKDQALKGSVFYFDKLLKEAEARRAARKAMEQRHGMHNLEAEALRLRTQLKELGLQRARLQWRVRRLEPGARVLERAREQMPEFQEVSDLVARFESLIDTQAALKQVELNQQAEMEATRARLLSLQEARQKELLRLSQQRTELREQLEAARELTQQWVRLPGDPPAVLARGLRHYFATGHQRVLVTILQNTRESRLTEIQNTASEKTLLLGRARMAVLNLYQLVRLKQGRRQAREVEDVEGQLEEVKLFIMNASATLANSAQAKPTATAS